MFVICGIHPPPSVLHVLYIVFICHIAVVSPILYLSPNFSCSAIDIINFEILLKYFMNWFLNLLSEQNFFCTRAYRNQNVTVTEYANLKKCG